jgi:hypothetical protein
MNPALSRALALASQCLISPCVRTQKDRAASLQALPGRAAKLCSPARQGWDTITQYPATPGARHKCLRSHADSSSVTAKPISVPVCFEPISKVVLYQGTASTAGRDRSAGPLKSARRSPWAGPLLCLLAGGSPRIYAGGTDNATFRAITPVAMAGSSTWNCDYFQGSWHPRRWVVSAYPATGRQRG